MNLSDIVVCSFHTADEYYRGCATSLRRHLERIGVAYRLEEIERAVDEDWADICRKKIGFLARVCDEHPDKKVFWIDVDCALLELPTYVAGFTADIIGFQRGFGSPMRIGYANRTRFWEPCFFGINATPSARKFIHDADLLEQSAEIKATDDYFFEESWRSNAPRLSFQVIPSAAVISNAQITPGGVSTFFSFGASGNVSNFKHRVKQHGRMGGSDSVRALRGLRHQALRGAKLMERKLPDRAARWLRKVADTCGITNVLTGGGLVGDRLALNGAGSPHRSRIVSEMIMAGQRGDVSRVDQAFSRLASSRIPSDSEIAAKRAADAFSVYASKNPDADPIRLAWWPHPFPGNFGDWLSPLILDARTDRSILYQSPTAPTHEPHIFSTGSIGRFIKPSSIVVGTGISSADIQIDRKARYISVRGPLTAELVQQCGGPNIESFGDPGALIARIIPVERGLTNGRIALVRHHKHANLPTALPESMDELTVLRSHPNEIRSFVAELNGYDAVITSAMHVMIICHSYGIPCCLVTFEGFESAVHGSGIKYRDYSLGVGLGAVYAPIPISTDLRRVDFDSMISKEKITESKLNEIEQAIAAGISTYLSMSA
ncbi:polysaccharide pyruvyl transferase family protein [Actinopolymorpha sp. B11F2]|uniref:polysaccharide pyruvyl transferase family protein n=1 Tax=Actinopolymorpha sp. B11F2 TaxID=3160862 RepID=UPI0032E3D17D